jgi:hypothetical protein
MTSRRYDRRYAYRRRYGFWGDLILTKIAQIAAAGRTRNRRKLGRLREELVLLKLDAAS